MARETGLCGVWGTQVKNAPMRGSVAGLAAVAALLSGGTANATPPPDTATQITTQTAQLVRTAQVAAQPVQTAQIAAQVARLLRNAPVAQVVRSAQVAWGAQPAAPATAAARDVLALPRAYRLTIREQYQATNYYCVPASISMSLSTFGVKVSQAALAKKMRTTIRGTGGDSAASVMDGYLHPRRFDDRIVGDVVGHPEILMQRVSYDVGSLRRAPIIQVWMERLPWNKDKIRGQGIGHAIIAYGYNQQAGTITVFDPWQPTGGSHTLSATSLATTLQNGSGMHYISRT